MVAEISTLEDVKQFAHYLGSTLHVNFHPDEDFASYINCETGEPSFSPEEVEHYNALMNKCFIVCEELGADIYEVMGEYLPIPAQS